MATFTPEIAERLDRTLIAWLTTVTPDGQPQSSPVWFLRDGERIVIYSLANAPRVRNVRANPRIAFNLNSNDSGGDVISIEGSAALEDGPPSTALPAYQAKYLPLITDYGWTPESFARDYPQRLVVTPARIRSY
jgi:PPOX class probable F420-dependent enzyme